MKTLPLSNDGVVETVYHGDDKEVIIESRMDVQPILDANFARQNVEHNKNAIGRHAASTPPIVFWQWVRDFKARYKIAYHQAPAELRDKFRREKLNDRDYSRLRTWQGRL